MTKAELVREIVDLSGTTDDPAQILSSHTKAELKLMLAGNKALADGHSQVAAYFFSKAHELQWQATRKAAQR